MQNYLFDLIKNTFEFDLKNQNLKELFKNIPHLLGLLDNNLEFYRRDTTFHKELFNFLIKYSDYFKASSHWDQFIQLSEKLIQFSNNEVLGIQLEQEYQTIFYYQNKFEQMKSTINGISSKIKSHKDLFSEKERRFFNIKSKYTISAYYRANQKYDLAFALAEEAQNIFKKNFYDDRSYQSLLGKVLFNKAASIMDRPLVSKKELSEAMKELTEASSYFEDAGSQRYFFRTQVRLAKVLGLIGRTKESEKILTEAPQLFPEQRVQLISNLYLAEIKFSQNKLKDSKKFLDRAISEALLLKDKRRYSHLLRLIKKLDPKHPYPVLFTKRELDCIPYIFSGKSSKEIAKSLDISFRTIEQHIYNMRKKANVSNKASLMSYLLKWGYYPE